jgi:hypothetical protein
MAGDEEITLEEIYAEVDKRIAAAIEKLKAELTKQEGKPGFRVIKRVTTPAK